MRITPDHIRSAARAQAKASGYDAVASVPAKARPGLINELSAFLGVTRSEVFNALAADWAEGAGRRGTEVTGAALGSPAASTRVTPAAGHFSPLTMRIASATSEQVAQASVATGPIKPERSLAQTEAKLSAPGRQVISDEQPADTIGEVKQRCAQLDSLLFADKAAGDYGKIDFAAIPDDHPIWDLPLYRGMGARDPAVHALKLTGRMVPHGDSGDYEGFKTYSHKSALDAYEFSFDPFIALKGASGTGYLVQTTLRELRATHTDVVRKTTDTEGGFFIGMGAVPGKVRAVGHPEGRYQLEDLLPENQNPAAPKFAARLHRDVVGAGGWAAFLEQPGKAQAVMKKQALREAISTFDYWTDQIQSLAPGDTYRSAALKRMASKGEGKSVAERLDIVEKELQNAQLRFLSLQERLGSAEAEPSDGAYRLY